MTYTTFLIFESISFTYSIVIRIQFSFFLHRSFEYRILNLRQLPNKTRNFKIQRSTHSTMFSTRKHFNLHEWSRSWSRTVNLDSSIRIDVVGGGDAFCIPPTNQRVKIGPRGRVSPSFTGITETRTNYRSCVHESSSLFDPAK